MEAIIAAVVGMTAGLLSLSAIAWFERIAASRSSQTGNQASLSIKLLLPAVPIPEWIEKRWVQDDFDLNLAQAGLEMSKREFLGFRWLIFVMACLMATAILVVRGVNIFPGFAAIILLAIGWSIPSLWLRWRVEDRQQQINHSLPDLMDRISLSLEAGLGFEMALRRTVGRQRDLLGGELKLVLGMLDRGHTKSEALDRLVRRNPSPDLRAFAAAVKQSERLGTPLTETLKVQGDMLRSRRRRRAQEASRRLPILIVFPLVFFFLPALLIVYLGPPLLHLLLNQ